MTPHPNSGVASAPHLRRRGFWLTWSSATVIGLATLLPGQSAAVSEAFCIVCGSVGGVDAVLNFALFVPLGAGLALIGMPERRTMLLVAVSSLLIETLQFSLIAGRDASIGDLLMNSMGGVGGFVLATRRHTLLFPAPRMARSLAAMWIAVWVALQALAAYSLLPSIPDGPYFGQHARDFGPGVAVFEGDVLFAAIDTLPIPDWEMRHAAHVRQSLERSAGTTVRAEVVTRALSRDVAPILRVAFGPHDGQLMILAQRGADFVFGLRTGAEVLRLRPMRYRLAHVILPSPATAASARTVLRASIGATGVDLSASTKGLTRTQTVDHRLSDGWRLFTPIQTYRSDDGYAALASSVWIAALVLPFGYWGFFATTSSIQDRARRVTLMSAACFALAWISVPQLFGFAGPPWWEFAALAAGVFVGATLAKRVGATRGAAAPAP